MKGKMMQGSRKEGRKGKKNEGRKEGKKEGIEIERPIWTAYHGGGRVL